MRIFFDDSATTRATATMPVTTCTGHSPAGRARRVVEHDELDHAADHHRDRGEPQGRAVAAQELADAAADQRGRERRQQRDVVGVEDALGAS